MRNIMLMMEKGNETREEHNTSRRARDLFIEASASPHFNIILLFLLTLLNSTYTIYWKH